MLTGFRAAVTDLLDTELDTVPGGPVPVYGTYPDDLNEVPCVVVGYPAAREDTRSRVVFDLALEVLVIGRRVQAGDSESELTTLTDAVWVVFNGTRAVKHATYSLAARALAPRLVTVAGAECPAYTITVDSSMATC